MNFATKLVKKHKFLFILSLFLVWRVGLCAVGALSQKILPYEPSFPYADAILAVFGLPQRLFSWGNFDGVHYLTIVDQGYHGAEYIQAFFPVYPILVIIINTLINNSLLSALIVSNISFILFLYVWFRFVENRYSTKLAKLSTIVILLFPSSFFFGAIYNESLFLLLVMLSFMSAEKNKYLATAFFIALASATRVIGIFLIPAILLEIIFADFDFGKMFELLWSKSYSKLNTLKMELRNRFKKSKKQIIPMSIVSTGALGLIAYMVYLNFEFGDPLYFFHVQSEFGGVRQETLVSYPQVVYRYIKILLTARPFDLKYISYVRELVVSTFGLGILLYSFKKVRISYFVFAVAAFFLPTLTGTFSSMPRYILVSFPIFIVLAGWAQKSIIFRYAWFIFSGILLVFNTMLFIQGYWVA